MSNNIILKKSSVGDKVPLSGDLQYGELALNYADGNLFYKNSSNAITTIASNKFVSVTGNVTGGNITTSGLANIATLEVTALANVKSTTAATSTTTGAIKTAGGIGVAGNAHIAGNVVGGNLQSLGAISSTGNITVGNVSYPNSFGTAGQFLTSYGNGQLYWSTSGGSVSGSLTVFLRSGSMTVSVIAGYFTVGTRTGNIDVSVT